MLANTQFVFDGKLKRTLIGGMILGLVCMVWTWISDDALHTRFWSNYLLNSVYFTGIAFMATFFLSAQITAFAGWNSVTKRILEAIGLFMGVGLILMLVNVACVAGHVHHLYHWNTPGISEVGNPLFDKIIAGKSSFLNIKWYALATLGFLGIWYFWATRIRKESLAQDVEETPGFDRYKAQRKWAASFLPLGGFLSTVFLWQTVMSIDPHWYSTMFAWYSMISMLLGCFALTIMLIIYLKSKGYMEYVTREHLHDHGKYLFGISIFWTYLWFDQFMLIWYANNGEETIYFKERMDFYPVLYWGNLVLNFVLPFLILMRNDTKRKFGTLFLVAAIVFFGHWWDYFYMIKPGARIAAHEHMELSEGHGSIMDKKNKVEGEIVYGTLPQAEHAAPAEAAKKAGEQAVDHAVKAAEAHAEQPVEHAATKPGEHPEGVQSTSPEEIPVPKAEQEHEQHAAEGGHDNHGAEHGSGVPEGKEFQLGYTLPGLDDIGLMIGFLSLFLFFVFSQLAKASLVPKNDPYLEESLHHQTGVFPEGEDHGDAHH